MKNLYKRIITVFLAVVTLFFSCVPYAYASGWEVLLSVPGDFWDWAVSSYYSSTENPFLSLFDKSVCPHCPDVTRRHNFKEQRTTVDGKTSLYYICEYCGKSAGEVGEEAYQQQVSDLPAPGYNSAGRLIWYTWNSFTGTGQYGYLNRYNDGHLGFVYQDATGLPFHSYNKDAYYGACGTYYSLDSSGSALSCVLRDHTTAPVNFGFSVKCEFSIPVAGSYRRLPTTFYASRLLLTDGTVKEDSASYNSDSSFVHYDLGQALPISFSKQFSFDCSYASAVVSFPVYEIIPDSAIDTTPGGQYSITTRPTTITGGNYGIIGDNGQIITINNNQQIINEGDNIYYNPATGQTYTITDWTYNYDNRIYNITLDTGDKVSVEYGDQNITIIEGDTNYIIYYIIQGSGSGDPSPAPTVCPHDWQAGSRTEPTCTSPGKTAYTCSKCGETKTDKLPATGHTWQVLRTVQTAYDEEGNLVQQGYTIYQCAVCSEQYKDTEGTGPPGGGDKDDDKETIWDKIANFFGSIVDGIAGIFEAILGKLLDALTALSEMLMGKVKDVVEVVLSVFDEVPKLFDGFLNFLGVVFPFLPPEITLLLTFGVIAVVFIGIIKAIRR